MNQLAKRNRSLDILKYVDHNLTSAIVHLSLAHLQSILMMRTKHKRHVNFAFSTNGVEGSSSNMRRVDEITYVASHFYYFVKSKRSIK